MVCFLLKRYYSKYLINLVQYLPSTRISAGSGVQFVVSSEQEYHLFIGTRFDIGHVRCELRSSRVLITT